MTACAHAEPATKTIDFNRDIRPILSDNCFQCHGPDKNKRKADLRLDTKEGFFNTIDDIRPVVPGKPGDSDLLRRMLVDKDDDELMPPAESNKSLTSQQIGKVRKWIEEGAEYKGHWAYLKPVKSSDASPEKMVDAFISAKLKDQNLQPSPEADKITLCRRVYFDLIGIPPTPTEVDAFVKDTGPEAYAKLVDGLLANRHFGERLAVFWLDQVRYADTIGYHSDNTMNVWPYRDWVITAFNQNMPFNQFTIEQLAGDLLPNSTNAQKVASAYNRLLQTTEEGGAQPREYEAKYASDRVRNVSAVWMAQTMGCCECHDHKFDPISTREFYGMEAFFADIQEAPIGRRELGMPLPDARQQAELGRLDAALADARKQLEVKTPELTAAQESWEQTVGQPITWETLDPETFIVQGESKLKKLEGGVLQSVSKVSANENYIISAHTSAKGITGFRLEALPDDALPAHGPGNSANGNFVLSDLKITATAKDGKPLSMQLRNPTADHSQEGFPIASVLDTKRPNRKGTGWAILNEVGKPHEAVFETAKPIGDDGGTNLSFTLEFQSQFAQHSIGKLRLSVTTAPEPSRGAIPKNVREALAVVSAKRTAAQNEMIAAHYRMVAPLLEPLRTQIAALEQDKQQLIESLPKCLVTAATTPRTVHLLPRGNWLDGSGPVMTPTIPAAMSSANPVTAPPPARLSRLDLAKWITSRENPLTARVFVNRLWKMFYGQGIARKVDDFGSQGDWPTHPELLDSLAVDFMESGWDVKRIIRMMVTTDTYRRSSVPTKDQRERDPANLWLARQNRFRLDAEFVRDNALAVSGLLVDRVGGKSVFPYQPAGYWYFLNFPPREWQNEKGDGLYRRGVYTHWQRTFLQPSLLAFDAPTREEAVCERTRSNVPQQALALLNDPTYVEAARVFAEKIMSAGSDDSARIEFGFRQALSRLPKSTEAKLLSDLLQKHRKEYTIESAKKTLAVGDAPAAKDLDVIELASWTSVARTILNLHETITRN